MPPVVGKGSFGEARVSRPERRLSAVLPRVTATAVPPCLWLGSRIGSGVQTIELTNGTVDVHVTVDCGPRILRYGFIGEENVLADASARVTRTPLGDWSPIGGHRLWVAPECMPGSYAPDLVPLQWERDSDTRVRVVAPVDGAGMEKHLQVDVAPEGTAVQVTHRIVNRTYWPVRVAPWAITVVAGDGTAVMPQPVFHTHAESFLPARRLVQWSYTDFTDPRLELGRRLVRLRPDPAIGAPQKIGAANEAGWSALVRSTVSFLKHATWVRGATYPDEGCHTEFFTAGDYLEMETLAPLCLLEPGEGSTHVETWALARDIDPAGDEAAQEAQILQALATPSLDRR